MSRRSVFKLGAAGMVGLAVPQVMMRAASAHVTRPDIAAPGFNRFTLGAFEVTTILDGLRPSDAPSETFGIDQKPETVAGLLEENLLPTQQFVNGFAPTLVNTGAELILFDTGLGAGARENGLGQMRDRMEASGYKREDVTLVVITHMHGDHIGGLMEAGAPAFPNARYAMGQTEFDFWTAPERMSGPTEGNAKAVAANVKPLAEKTTFLADGAQVAGGITAILAPGHTPGHMVFHLESDGRRLAITADTANHYVLSLQRPDWHVRFDADKDMGAQTRRKVFDMIAADKIPFIGYHMPFPSVGYVEKIDGGFRYIPETYQLDL